MRSTVLVLVVLAACGDEERRGSDATTLDVSFGDADVIEVFTPDTSQPETVADTSQPDTVADTSQPDTVADTSQPETVADTTPETVADTTPETVADTTPETVADTTPGDVVGPGCLTLGAGHQRHVVLSFPYSEPDGEQSPRWKVYALGPDGAPGAQTADFELSRAYGGRVAFRPDGALAVTVHDDGSIGVFALDAFGEVSVIETALDVGAYVVEAHVDGDRLLLVDPNWQNNGGGIYSAPLGCDGTVGQATLLYPTKNAQSLVVRGVQHLVAAVEVVDTTHGSLHLVAPSGPSWLRLAGADLFPDDDDIISSLVVTDDGQYALVGDNQFFAPVDNRVGIATLEASSLKANDLITPIEDPVALVASPYNDAVLVVSGYGDAVRVLDYLPGADPVFLDVGEPDYITAPPSLPFSAVSVGGAFFDQVLVVENIALRRFRFEGDGSVSDLGKVLERDAYDAIPGAIGVQP